MAPFENVSKNQNASKAFTYDFSSPLDSLPTELVALVASHLDFSSTLGLASALPCLRSFLLESPLQWQLLMSKVPWKTDCDLDKSTYKQLVGDILAFLPPNSLHLFNDLLFSICSKFRSKDEGDCLEVELPSSSPLKVSPHGFLLLATADNMRRRKACSTSTEGEESDTCSFQLLNATLQHPAPTLLRQLALTISSQKSAVAHLELELISVENGEDAEWCGRLLQNCQTWRVEELELLGQVNLSWNLRLVLVLSSM